MKVDQNDFDSVGLSQLMSVMKGRALCKQLKLFSSVGSLVLAKEGKWVRNGSFVC